MTVDRERLVRDAVLAYEVAQERAEFVREQWEDAGRPTTVCHNNGVESVAPLLKALQDCETHAARRWADFRDFEKKSHRGPAPSAVIAPAKPARLRSVG